MLSPEQLEKLPLPLVQTMEEVEEEILNDICRRLRLSGEMTESAVHQIRTLQEHGYHLKDIEKKIRKQLDMGKKQLEDILDRAVERNQAFANNLYSKMDLFPPPTDALFLAQMQAVREQTKSEFQNITQSMGFAVKEGGKTKFYGVAKAYQKILDKAAVVLSSGSMDYHSAIKQAVTELTNSGIRTVYYASGWSNNIDVATRRAVMTGVNQMSGIMADKTAEDLGTTIMEITAHAGARPSHAVWQGQLVDKSGRDKRYLTLDDIGYDTVQGFQGANCRHDWYPYVPGISERAYTDEQLKNIDPPPFSYQGKQYNAYEATQQQRKLETAMRASKRKMIGYDSAGLQEAYQNEAIRLQRIRTEYENFSNTAGLRTQPKRAQVQGFGNKQNAKAMKGKRTHD